MTTQSHVLPNGYALQWYEIQHVLGQGGFGITYLARDTNLNIEVAIKEYLPTEFAVREIDSTVMPRSEEVLDSYAWGRERFLDEARLLATFDHPAIVRVHTFLEANNTAYMVMRFEHGASLKHWFRKREFNEDELLDVLHVIMNGVEVLHKRDVIHRDIKPDNIYVGADSKPVLLDFGSARHALGGATKNVTSMVSGGYSAPEQYGTDATSQGPWTDIYSLAATIYFGMVGRAPLDAMDRSQRHLSKAGDDYVPLGDIVGDAYSAAFCQAIDHGLALRREDRPQSIAEWRREMPPPPNAEHHWTDDIDAEAPTRLPDRVTGTSPRATQSPEPSSTASNTSSTTSSTTSVTVTINQSHILVLAAVAVLLLAAIGSAFYYMQQPASPELANKVSALSSFQDRIPAGGFAPSMQVLPPGTFLMGAGTLEPDAEIDERPQHERVIAEPFALGAREVTVAEFRQFVDASNFITDAENGLGCFHRSTKWENSSELSWRAPGFAQRDDHPVVCVTRTDAEAYVAWLSEQTGRSYRLPSEAEWEYAARAGIQAPRYWGDTLRDSCRYANASDKTLIKDVQIAEALECSDGFSFTAPGETFMTNNFGLADMLGNVWEWTNDCWRSSYLSAGDSSTCGGPVLRGGSWSSRPVYLRAANRYEDTRGNRSDVGFRVAAKLDIKSTDE